MAEGWIRLHRKICSNPLFKEKRRFSKFEAWIDILLSANHRDGETLIDFQKITVNRGSYITSEVKLAAKWGWHRETVRRYLALLEREQMLVKNSTPKYTALTVVKYDEYQTDRTGKVSTIRQQSDSDTTQTRMIKNDKNDKNKNICTFEQFWEAYPKRKSKGQAEKAWEKIKPNEQLHNRIIKSLEQAKTSADWQKDGGKYIPYPATWLNAKGWEDEYKPAITTGRRVSEVGNRDLEAIFGLD